MSIALDWDNADHHIIRCDFTGRWTWEQFRDAAHQLSAFVETVPYDVYLVINGHHCQGMPRGTSPFPHLSSVLRRLPRNLTLITIASDDAFIRKVFSVVRHFHEGTAQLALMDNLNDARLFIRATIARQSESKRLLAQLLSSDSDIVLQTLEILRDRDWLYDGTLENSHLERANFAGADLFMGNLASASLVESQLHDANLFMVNLENANLFRANLSGTNLQDANLTQAMLQEATLGEAQMSPCNLTGANLRGARLWSANLQTSTLIDTIFNDADLRHARLSRVSATNARFVGARMQGVEMLFAHFNEAAFNQADLSEADMRRCNLRHATFNDARAVGARLEYANLGGADLCGADLRHAVLDGTRFDEKTILPDGSHWMPGMDMRRFTDPLHRDFWHRQDENKQTGEHETRLLEYSPDQHPDSRTAPYSMASRARGGHDTRPDF